MLNIPTVAELNLNAAIPAIFLLVATGVLLMVNLFVPEERKHYVPGLAVVAIAVTFALALLNFYPENPVAFGGMFVGDTFAGVANIIVLFAGFIVVLASVDYIKRSHIDYGEFYALLLMSISGAMFMASANDLIMVFIALELLSIPLYVLAAFRSLDKQSAAAAGKSEESGAKYFILGAFASAFFVYGSALIYGATGTTNLELIFASVGTILATQTTATFLLLVGSALIIVGLGFKVAVVPFHMWTPDVYEGSPTPVAAFMSVAAKVGGFAALIRILMAGLATLVFTEGDTAIWQTILAIVSAATLILGNVVAISQSNLKRMLAYSSISHAGYILMAVAATGTPGVEEQGMQSALLYLLTYMFANLGAFIVALSLEKDDGSNTEISDFAGLWKSNPVLASAMGIFMLSLTGIPLTAGFVGKLFAFSAAIEANLIWLVVIAALASVVGAFYYVRVIVMMFLRTEDEGDEAVGATRPVRWAVYVTMAGTMILGIVWPVALNIVTVAQIG